jgi:hypothetical protein
MNARLTQGTPKDHPMADAPPSTAPPAPAAPRNLLPQINLIFVALALVTTVTMSTLSLRQTTNNFRLERTGAFVSRFNSLEMVELREDADRWLDSGETPAELYARSMVATAKGSDQTTREALDAKAARTQFARLRTLANFFQEFGTAYKFGSLDEAYAHDLLGGVCIRYSDALGPFIEFLRVQRKRPTMYSEFFWMRDRMKRLDQ